LPALRGFIIFRSSYQKEFGMFESTESKSASDDCTEPANSMSVELAGDTADTSRLPDLSARLEEVYEQVPSTCCANSGECCVLTEAEIEEGYATMFPLYRAEYANIVDYVRSKFSAERQEQLLAITDERPQSCPFLDSENHCTIYPVRPLICRTYAVMNHDTIAEAAVRHKGEVPDQWIRGFALREGNMVCPRVTVLEPDKLIRHAYNLLSLTYERTMMSLSRKVELASGERWKFIRKVIGRRSSPLRWTWGGFNSLRFAPAKWLEANLKTYWRDAELREGD
jgi:Fe-S-cluster containining protein